MLYLANCEIHDLMLFVDLCVGMIPRHELHKPCMPVTMGKLSCTNIRGLKG